MPKAGSRCASALPATAQTAVSEQNYATAPAPATEGGTLQAVRCSAETTTTSKILAAPTVKPVRIPAFSGAATTKATTDKAGRCERETTARETKMPIEAVSRNQRAVTTTAEAGHQKVVSLGSSQKVPL